MRDINIYGIPIFPMHEVESLIHPKLEQFFSENFDGITFVQVDPTKYMYNYRQLALKNTAEQVNFPQDLRVYWTFISL